MAPLSLTVWVEKNGAKQKQRQEMERRGKRVLALSGL